MKITVKRWIADQKNDEMKRYNYFADVEYYTTEAGTEYYANTEDDTVTYINAEVIKETAKAINVRLSCGAVDGNVGTFDAWFPKSQVVAIA